MCPGRARARRSHPHASRRSREYKGPMECSAYIPPDPCAALYPSAHHQQRHELRGPMKGPVRPPTSRKRETHRQDTRDRPPCAGISVTSPQWLQSRIGHGNVTPRAHTSARHRAGREPAVNPRSGGHGGTCGDGTPALTPRAATHGQPPGRAPGSPPEEPPAVILWVVLNMRVPGNCTPATRQWGLCACARKRYGDRFGAGDEHRQQR